MNKDIEVSLRKKEPTYSTARPANPDDLEEGELITEWIVVENGEEIEYTIEELEEEYYMNEVEMTVQLNLGEGSLPATVYADPTRQTVRGIDFYRDVTFEFLDELDLINFDR